MTACIEIAERRSFVKIFIGLDIKSAETTNHGSVNVNNNMKSKKIL